MKDKNKIFKTTDIVKKFSQLNIVKKLNEETTIKVLILFSIRNN